MKHTLDEVLRQTTTTKFSFFVPGEPASQGSKNAIPRIVTGKDGRPKALVNMVEQDTDLKPWRNSIANMAKLMLPSTWQTEGCFTLGIIFFMSRPKYHKNHEGEVRDDAPLLHSKRKDWDKMARAVGDALTGVCYDDDSMIVSGHVTKVYSIGSLGPGAWIAVGRLDEQAASQAVLQVIEQALAS